ncbi:MAG: oxygen-independent coproporphyrinogen III oxidase [Gammaproteobacteria bacterium]|nr:oxygen-independent coproporphyrinogen III oxidase [Gammaproteobacteria bacterium]MDH5728769.1 oxygen-independent coproporphyrinogen III oxidase [Gammaproteobacteria bacterium]
MNQNVSFDIDLIRRYDKSGPRYTSYPTAVQFDPAFDSTRYAQWAEISNQRSRELATASPISLYFHIPFCDTVCFYCGCNKVATKNRDLAQPYLNRVYRELEMQSALFDDKRIVEQLHWGGGTPTFISHAQMRELMDKTREQFTLLDDDSGEYSIEIDPREVDNQTIQLLRDIGFNRLSLGVQDLDPQVQKAVNRIQPEAVTMTAIENARKANFKSVSIDLIYGLPFQSVKTFSNTLERIIDISPDRLSVFNYAHLPEMFKPQRRINEADLPSAQEKLDILQFVIERLTGAGYVYIGMDHFAKPNDELAVAQREKTLYRNFQGYSTHSDCDLIGLGITSIGKVGDTYSQNLKTLDEYYAAIDSGQLAVFRGIELDEDDLLRREVITQLICHFDLTKSAIENQFSIKFDDYFSTEMEELKSMANDGLIELSDQQITVQPAGHLLIRNICMVFDKHLRQQKQQRFSKVI